MDALASYDNDGKEGYLSHTLQSIFWEQQDIVLSFVVLFDECNQYQNVLGSQARRQDLLSLFRDNITILHVLI
jgi:hypothetical protein